ncbi:serine/threonine-protein kinase [Blastococcus xanthinilyticus]|uniref:non-specific serine/threonine protein kinase n=1 Tax=Blastococcus xanthinilyticus TaxID=1564164 RepID=A0A5S5CVW2_9ACTN|nr:serine/threonine-protein kinase [Blastococcus xanthinilyticus]TYP87128.1 serine/threonine protein kinase [Blastococcus xanthinilyticus]
MSRPITGPGRLVAGRYRLESQIGGGGMGTVWLARDERLGRRVAVKEVRFPLGADQEQIDEQRQRALREGRIAARLSHPHAISVYDVALEGGTPWLVMEYLPSRSLAEVLGEDGVLRVDQVAQIGAQVADALAATHAAGIVHRDVKPANVLIGRGGRVAGLVKITDFGISHASGDVTLTQTGQITGTPAYLAPEVAQGMEMTEASDVFSLGATLYTCVEGGPPFGMDDNALGMLHRVAGGQITPPRQGGALTEPLLRMLAADPGARPAMTAVRDELAALAAGRDGDTTTVLLARTDLRPSSGPAGTSVFAAAPVAADRVEPPAASPVGPPTPAPPTPAPPTPTPRTAPAPVVRTGGRLPPASVPASSVPASSVPASSVPASPPAGDTPARAGRRRGAWAALAVVVVLLAGGLALWLGPLGEPDGDATATGTPTSSSEAPSPTGEPAETPAETQTPVEPVAPPPAEDGEDGDGEDGEDGDDEGNGNGNGEGNGNGNGNGNGGDQDADPLAERSIRDFVRDYHRLVIDDPASAWDRTGPTLRANISRENYIRYWDQFEDVRISDLEAGDGDTTATATMELRYADGRRETGPHEFTFLVRDGQLVLDSDFPVD